jgi:hypothetical protein
MALLLARETAASSRSAAALASSPEGIHREAALPEVRVQLGQAEQFLGARASRDELPRRAASSKASARTSVAAAVTPSPVIVRAAMRVPSRRTPIHWVSGPLVSPSGRYMIYLNEPPPTPSARPAAPVVTCLRRRTPPTRRRSRSPSPSCADCTTGRTRSSRTARIRFLWSLTARSCASRSSPASAARRSRVCTPGTHRFTPT